MTNLNEQITALLGTIESQKQTHDALIKKLQRAVEALEKDTSRLSTLANESGEELVFLWAQESHEALKVIRSNKAA